MLEDCVDQKDQITLLRSLNILKNKIKFHLIIIGRRKNKPELEFYIKENNLRKFVTIFYSNNPYITLKIRFIYTILNICERIAKCSFKCNYFKKICNFL